MSQEPTIGRIVHYKDREGKTMPAIIVEVHEKKAGVQAVSLQLFHPTPSEHPRWAENVIMAAGPRDAEPGQWWWPERL